MKKIAFFLLEKDAVRYVIIGGTSACTNLVFLFLLTEFAGTPYLVSAVISFFCGFFVSFYGHKFWTFKNGDLTRIRSQMRDTFLVACLNLAANAFLLAFFTEVLGIWYMISEAMAIILISFSTYFFLKKKVFDEARLI